MNRKNGIPPRTCVRSFYENVLFKIWRIYMSFRFVRSLAPSDTNYEYNSPWSNRWWNSFTDLISVVMRFFPLTGRWDNSWTLCIPRLASNQAELLPDCHDQEFDFLEAVLSTRVVIPYYYSNRHNVITPPDFSLDCVSTDHCKSNPMIHFERYLPKNFLGTWIKLPEAFA